MKIKFIILVATVIAWVAFLIFNEVDYCFCAAGALFGELTFLCCEIAFPKKYDGHLEISQKEDGNTLYSLNLDSDPEDWAKMNEILLKVEPKKE